MKNPFRPCALIPTYNNPSTVGPVVQRVQAHLPDVVLVDDGSSEPALGAVRAVGERPGVVVHYRPENGGKGAAVKDGFGVGFERGFTHALQIDADGQHDVDDIPAFLEAARSNPEALILGMPVFDASVPRSRLIGRQISRFWVTVETMGMASIGDPLCGFRVYPLRAALEARASGMRMDFDPEIAVRMVWGGAPVVNVPTGVRYLSGEKGGVSHFHWVRDNAMISAMHTRLVFGAIGRLLRIT